jgi:hypothetical protein
MKNLSLLFLVVTALPVELFSSSLAQLTKGGKGAATKSAWPTTPSSAPQATRRSSSTKDTPVIDKQPSALPNPALDDEDEGKAHPVVNSVKKTKPCYYTRWGSEKAAAAAQFEKDFQTHRDSFYRALEAPHDLPVKAQRSYYHFEAHQGEGTRIHATTKDQLSPEDRAAYEARYASIARHIENVLSSSPYISPTDEIANRKALFTPLIADLKKCGDALSSLPQARTKGQKSTASSSLPSEKITYTLPIKGKEQKIRTLPLADILSIMARKQVDPYATTTESARTVANCGRSIIEGSRISDLDHTATNFASTPEEKTAILHAKRLAEFTTILRQLEGYAKARSLEETSVARLAELEAKASELEGKLLRPASETDRIDTERALLTINREKAGIKGQLEGAKRDRHTKNNAIVVARAESGSLKALLGRFGGKTADYVSNEHETPLMIEELFSKVLPELDKKERKKQAAAFLDILLGKTKPHVPGRLTWTGQQSVKATGNYPEFSCIVKGTDLSGTKGIERIPYPFAAELAAKPESSPTILPHSPLLPLIALYTKRAGLEQEEMSTSYCIPPSLETLRQNRLKKEKRWEFNGKSQEWEERKQTPVVVALSSTAFTSSIEKTE